MAEESLTGKKAWWQRPDNWVSIAGLAIVGWVGLKGLDYILPLLNRVLENVVYTAFLAGAVGIIGWMAINKDFHRLLWHGYKMGMRWVTEWFVTLDPISILKSYVETLVGNRREIGDALSALRGQEKKLEEKILNKGKEYEASMTRMSQAKQREGERGMKQVMALQSRKAGRLEESNMTYQGLLNKLRTHIAITEKMLEASDFMIADITDTVEVETEKRDTIQQSYKAMAASRRILMAGQQREMYDMAMEHLTNDYHQKLGEIEQFMEDSRSFVTSMDLDNGVFEAQALDRLADWEKRSEHLLSGGTGKTKFRVGSHAVPDKMFPDPEELPDPAEEKRALSQSYADLFDKLK